MIVPCGSDALMCVCVELLIVDNVIELPLPYGMSRVISLPRLNSTREYVLITLFTMKGVITLSCTRNKPFNVYTHTIH